MIVETSGGEFEKEVSFQQDLTFKATSRYFAEKKSVLGISTNANVGSC